MVGTTALHESMAPHTHTHTAAAAAQHGTHTHPPPQQQQRTICERDPQGAGVEVQGEGQDVLLPGRLLRRRLQGPVAVEGPVERPVQARLDLVGVV